MNSTKRRLLLVLGVAISVAALAVLLARIDWAAFAQEYRSLRFPWVVASCACITLAIMTRAFRWCRLASFPLRHAQPFRRATVFGLFANLIYPLRAGEVLRILALRDLSGVTLGRAASSAALDRATDAIALGASAILVFGNSLGIVAAEYAMLATLGLAFSLLLGLGLLARFGGLWQRVIGYWSARVSHQFQERVGRFIGETTETSRVIYSMPALTTVAALTVIAYGFDFGVVACAMLAFGWEVPAGAPLLVLIMLAVATALPSGPGYAGTFQVACVLALAQYGFSETAGMAYSILLQVCLIATTALLALIAGFAQMRRRAPLRPEQFREAAGRHPPA